MAASLPAPAARTRASCGNDVRWQRWIGSSRTVHPHVRGDDEAWEIPDGDYFGSPPRAWGRPSRRASWPRW